jgi:methionyl-tRNA formyltransferase
MQMEAGLDTGPVLLQRRLELARGTTAGDLETSLSTLGAAALLEALLQLAEGRAQAQAQSSEGITYAAKIAKSEALIDWSAPALQIERQVLAFNPRPGATTTLGSEPVRVLRAQVLEGGRAGEPGVVLELRRDALVIACGGGTLALQLLQRPGRNPVNAREFAAACHLAAGQRLGVGGGSR